MTSVCAFTYELACANPRAQIMHPRNRERTFCRSIFVVAAGSMFGEEEGEVYK